MSFVKRVGTVLAVLLSLLVIVNLFSLRKEGKVSEEVITEAITEEVKEKDIFLRDEKLALALEKELELENEISLWINNALLSSRSRTQSLDSSEADVAATYVEEDEESYEESYEEEEYYEEEVYIVEEDHYEESYEEEYYEETEEDSYHSEGSYTLSDLQYHGVINWNGNRYTYYSQQVLPGGGLKIPGRHVNAGGFVSDGDGYIVLANDVLDRGTVVDTPFGYYGKIYDRFGTGKPSHHFDVYTQ